MPLLNFLDEQHVHTQQPSITNNVEPEHSVLPPSFTDLLTGNSIDIEKGANANYRYAFEFDVFMHAFTVA